MNTLLNELMSDLEHEQLTAHQLELCIRKLAAIATTHEAQISNLQNETLDITEKILW